MSFAYMPVYTGGYIRDTQHLSCSEHGIFLKLLMHCWDQKGPAPLDERKLCGIVNARSSDEIEALRRILAEFFIRMEDGHYNKRMQKEIERSEAISGARSEAGRIGAAAKAKHLPSKSQASAKQVPLSPSPSPSPSLAQPLQSSLELHSEANASVPMASPAKPRATKPSPDKPTSSLVWEAYSNAYLGRYGVLPVRNAAVNGQIANFVSRVGIEDAPHVAAFFLTHNSAYYVRMGHAVKAMIGDAEKLRTEWATQKQITSTQAMQADKTQTNFGVFAPMIEAARQERLRKESELNGSEG